MKIDLSQLITAESKAKAALLAAEGRLADLRWRHEVGGIVLKGFGAVATDREAQARLTGLVQAVETGLASTPVSWKTGSGWVDLEIKELRALAQAVTTHVQAAFAAERAVLTGLQSGKVAPEALEKAFEKALAP